MRKTILLLLLLLSNISIMYLSASQLQNKINLMPYPSSVEMGNGKFRINKEFSVQVNNVSHRLEGVSNRFLMRLSNRTGLFLNNPFIFVNDSITEVDFIINAAERAELELGILESYELVINSNEIRLTSQTDIGAIRGIETLLQLVQSDAEGYYFPNLKIVDSPRFVWRGLLIDVCRHFMPIDVIKRNIDAMAAVKLNVLHLHLSEDQGFRVESLIYPKLHELGSDGFYYTQNQIREIVNYAAERGIRVVPEFDVPGHATAIITAYPELASLPGEYEIERNWGVFDPTLNPIKDETYIFLHNLFSEMAELFPDDYFHIGGDENNGKQWDANPEIQEFMKSNNIKDNHGLQAYFNNKLLVILENLDKKMVGWDEIFSPEMPTNIVIQSWRGKEAMVEAAKKGYKTILSNGYYIDLIQPTDFHYLNDPLPDDIDLTKEEKKYVLGGEATMWAEMISPETIDSRIWPRTAAIAERFWSPQKYNNIEWMYERLEVISLQLEEHGLTHIKNIDMMLRRMTGNHNIQPLKILLSVIEPVKIYKRNQLRKQTQQTPLTRIVDAATPDAESARKFRSLVDRYLKGRSSEIRNVLISMLESWKTNHIKLISIIENSPILYEVKPLSENLFNVSKIGLEILEMVDKNQSPNDVWLANVKSNLELAEQPVAQTELMIVSAIGKLLNIIY